MLNNVNPAISFTYKGKQPLSNATVTVRAFAARQSCLRVICAVVKPSRTNSTKLLPTTIMMKNAPYVPHPTYMLHTSIISLSIDFDVHHHADARGFV